MVGPFASLFAMLMILAATEDVLRLRIANWLNLLIAASFFPAAFASGMPADMILTHVAWAAVLLIAGIAGFVMRLFGAGDAKLLAAAGLWFGLQGFPSFIVLTALAGGAMAVVIGAWSLVKMDSGIKDGLFYRRLGALSPGIPYGYALAAGALMALPQSWWLSSPVP